MSLAQDIARCQALVAANDQVGLAAALPALEAANPVTQAEWEGLRAIFTAINRSAWVEIMTTRFLIAEPSNIAARLEQVLLLSTMPGRAEDARGQAEALAAQPLDQPAHYLRLGTIFTNIGAHRAAAAVLKRGQAAYPDDIRFRIETVFALLRVQDTAQVKAELVALRANGRGKPSQLLLASGMALWIKETAMSTQLLNEVEPILDPNNHHERGTFMVQAQRTGDFDRLLRHLPLTDFRQIHSPQLLEELYQALEGRGFYDAERQLIESALASDPGNDVFQKRARAMAAGRGFLPATKLPPPTQPKPPGLLGRLRDRIARR